LDLQNRISTNGPTDPDETYMRIEEKAVGSPREWSSPSIQIRIFWEASNEVPVSEQLQRTDIFGRMMLFVFCMLLLRFDDPISSTSNDRDAYEDTARSLVTTNGYTGAVRPYVPPQKCRLCAQKVSLYYLGQDSMTPTSSMVLDALFLCKELLPSGKSGFWSWDGSITAGRGANCRTQRANELEGRRTLHGWVQVDSTLSVHTTISIKLA
jgi:hypothetical protein